MEILVCPLSGAHAFSWAPAIIKGEIKVSKHNRVCVVFYYSFRYDAENQELICDKLGVVYPVKDGIPYLDPQEGILLLYTCTQNGIISDSLYPKFPIAKS